MNTYTTIQGDTWDLIALATYGDESRIQPLMQARENAPLIDIEIFPAGVVVAVPELPDTASATDDLPEWRR